MCEGPRAGIKENMRHPYLSLLCLVAAFAVRPASAADAWSAISVIHDQVDGMFYAGSEFVAYRFSPTLRLYSSARGVAWEAHVSDLAPFAMGHDVRGTLYALTQTKQESGIPAWYIYTTHLWRCSDAVHWQYLGELFSYIEVAPVGASFCASDSHLLIKLYNIWGSGWVSGPPPQPLFRIDIANPTHFAQVPNGQSIEGVIWTGSEFVATKDHAVVVSADGLAWDPLFSLNQSYPPERILATRQSQFFVYGFFSGITVANGLSERTSLPLPVRFDDLTRPLTAFACNGAALVLTDENTCFVSTNYSQTWQSNLLTSARGLAFNGSYFLLGDQVGTDLFLYRFTPPPEPTREPTPLQMEIRPCESVNGFITNRFRGALLQADGPDSADAVVQVEVSADLETWLPHGLPSTHAPVTIDIDQIDAPAAFFRMYEVKAE